MWMKTCCSRNAKIAKRNVLRVSHEKALLVKTSCHDFSHSSHVLARSSLRGKASRKTSCEIHIVFNRHLSLHTLSHTTTYTMKSQIKYRVNMIEHNYNQI